MKAIFVETGNFIYYGEVNKANPKIPHGKGCKFDLDNKYLDEAWFINGVRNVRGRWIDDCMN